MTARNHTELTSGLVAGTNPDGRKVVPLFPQAAAAIPVGANNRSATATERLLAVTVGTIALSTQLLSAQTQTELQLTNPVFQSEEPSQEHHIWENEIGEGFRPDTQSVTFALGANYGVAAFGGREAHHLAIASLTYGHMLGHVLGEGHWYRGNLELRLEIFTGAEFSPSTEWFVGLTPHLRYNFATGSPWIPFVDGGAGVTATGIGPPDLSGTFEFNLQAGGGIHWFLKEDLALTLEAHYLHWSCAGLHQPNLGLNGVTGMLGVSFFF